MLMKTLITKNPNLYLNSLKLKKAKNPIAPYDLILKKYMQAEFLYPRTDFNRRKPTWNYPQVFTTRPGPAKKVFRNIFTCFAQREWVQSQVKALLVIQY